MDVSMSNYVSLDTALWFIGLWTFMAGFIMAKKDFRKLVLKNTDVGYRYCYHKGVIEATDYSDVVRVSNRMVKSFYTRLNIGGLISSLIPWLYMHSIIFYIIPFAYVILIYFNWFEGIGNQNTRAIRLYLLFSSIGALLMFLTVMLTTGFIPVKV